jgi:hypothetical protein
MDPIMTVGPFSLKDILAARVQEPEKPMTIPQPDAAAETLSERWLELNTHHEMEAGDVVIFKAGFDPRHEELMELPLILTDDDPLDYPDKALRQYSIGGKGDTVVLSLFEDGTGGFFQTDRRFLEPFPRASGPLPKRVSAKPTEAEAEAEDAAAAE